MAEALISVLLEQLVPYTGKKISQEVTLIKGAEKDVRKLKSNLQAIQAVLDDAEKKQLADSNVRGWLNKLTDVSCDMDDVLDEWGTAVLKSKIKKEGRHVVLKKVCLPIPSSCCDLNLMCLRRHIASQIKDINERLDVIAKEKDNFSFHITSATEQVVERPKTVSLVDVSKIRGRDNDRDHLSKLLCNNADEQGSVVTIIPIVGMGGIGKTTLAQQVFDDARVKAHFDCRIWVCVSDPFDEMKIARAIAEGLKINNVQSFSELETLLRLIHEHIERKRFFLVLDDVWTKDEEKWEKLKQPLRNGAPGSKILVTTRNEDVVEMMRATTHKINLKLLSEDECWLVFSHGAFRNEEERRQLQEIGRKISSKCKGLPLAAKVLGSLMRSKKTRKQWDDVLHNGIWETGAESELFAPFLLTYYDLPSLEKRCFSYCSVFPKGYVLDRNELVEMWMSQGYLSHEEEGHNCFETLAMRSLFQDFEMSRYSERIIKCKMHDIVHDFTQFLTKDEAFIMDVDGVNERSMDKPRHVTLVLGKESQVPTSMYNGKHRLRTLRVQLKVEVYRSFICLDILFSQFPHLRTLTLTGPFDLTKLPNEMGNLRYLDLSNNYVLKSLPEWVCGLCNLQTLRIQHCIAITRLPEGIGKLINLRHLVMDGCIWLSSLGFPKGLRKLTCLRTLDTMIVPYDKRSYFNMEEFGRSYHLDQLVEGKLLIRGCSNLESEDEARKAQLAKKEQLVELELKFARSLSNERRFKDEMIILEGLQPHSNLKSLAIHYYRGKSMCPAWMMSLINLRELRLFYCEAFSCLPPLGKLPSLESLHICGNESVKFVGLEFLGSINRDDASITCCFPKLRQLRFSSMWGWRKWEGGVADTDHNTSLTIMPCLHSLRLKNCYLLEALPDFLRTTPLQDLSVTGCNILSPRCRKLMGEEWDKISQIPNIQIDVSTSKEMAIDFHQGIRRPPLLQMEEELTGQVSGQESHSSMLNCMPPVDNQLTRQLFEGAYRAKLLEGNSEIIPEDPT